MEEGLVQVSNATESVRRFGSTYSPRQIECSVERTMRRLNTALLHWFDLNRPAGVRARGLFVRLLNDNVDCGVSRKEYCSPD